MTATVRFFASAAEAAGLQDLEVDVATVGQLASELDSRFGEKFAKVRRQCSVMVGGTLSESTTAIPDGSVVDFLPPFAGG